jgi:hypothetical protein
VVFMSFVIGDGWSNVTEPARETPAEYVRVRQ